MVVVYQELNKCILCLGMKRDRVHKEDVKQHLNALDGNIVTGSGSDSSVHCLGWVEVS